MDVKKRDAEASIKKIIEAAKIVFSERGYKNSTLTEIGERSGLSRSTPSYFFKNKGNLYKTVIEELVREEKEYVNQFQHEGTVTKESIRQLLASHIEHAFAHPYLSKILIRESLDDNPFSWSQEYFPNGVEWSFAYLEEAQRKNIIRQDIDLLTLWIAGLSTAWLPIITQNTFMKSIGRDLSDPEFIQFHQKQVELIIFEALLVD